MNATAQIRHAPKKYGTIREWCAVSGMGRTTTYDRIGAGNIVAVKVGDRTLVDFDSGFSYLDSLPRAKIRRASKKRLPKRLNTRVNTEREQEIIAE